MLWWGFPTPGANKRHKSSACCALIESRRTARCHEEGKGKHTDMGRRAGAAAWAANVPRSDQGMEAASRANQHAHRSPERTFQMAAINTARMDEKGRVSIPRPLRDEMDLAPGTLLAFVREGGEIHVRPVGNPFTTLMHEAEEEYAAGRTRNIREFAHERNIAVSSADHAEVGEGH